MQFLFFGHARPKHEIGYIRFGNVIGGGKRIYRSRIIDIDILMIGDWRIDEDDLKIPHPMMVERDFVMVPLREIYGMDGFSADR